MTFDRRDFESLQLHPEKRPRFSDETHWDTLDAIPEFAFILKRYPPAVDHRIPSKQIEPDIVPELAFLIRQQKDVNPVKELKSKDNSISSASTIPTVGILAIPKAPASAPRAKNEKAHWVKEFESTFNEVLSR